MSKLLIDESPLQVLPRLAVAIGLNEAVVLQQVHYWLGRSTTTRGGHRWVYNTVQQWQEQFPFWSADTVRRTLASLKDKGLLVGEALSENRFDKTMFYRIDYRQLATIDDGNLQSSEGCNLPPSVTAGRNPLTKSTETTAETTETTLFEAAWAEYPKRSGGNSRAAALKAWVARINKGVDPQVMLEGVKRYAAHIKAEGKEGSPFVKQASTFFGPDGHYLEAYELSKSAKPKPTHTGFSEKTYVGTPDNEIDWANDAVA